MLGSIYVYKSFMDCLIAALFLTGMPSGRSRQRRSLHILDVSRHSIKHSHNLFLDLESWIFDFSFTTNALPKTNIAPENRQSLRKFHLPTTDLQGCNMLVSGRISNMDSERSVQWNHPAKSSPPKIRNSKIMDVTVMLYCPPGRGGVHAASTMIWNGNIMPGLVTT